MKKIWMIFLCLMGPAHCLANQYNFDTMTVKPGFQLAFDLSNSENNNYNGNLDCQSFFQKFDIKDQKSGELFENYITISECEYLYHNISNCLETNTTKCINTDDIFREDCNCR